MSRSRNLSSIPKSSFDISKVEYKDLADVTTIVKVPIKSQDVRISTASMGPSFAKTNTLWSRIKSAWYEFKVPTEKLQKFKTSLIEFFKNPNGTWNKFQFERKLKTDGLERINVMETYEFDPNMSIVMLYIHHNPEYHVLFEEKVA